MNIKLTEKQVLIVMIALDKYRNNISCLASAEKRENLNLIIDEIKTALLESI